VTSESAVVSVFGGQAVARGSDDYEQARRLGRRLAEQGFVLCTGGYGGTMEAVSRGAKEAGGRTIGVTVDLFGATPPNDWVDEVENTASLLLRLDKLTVLGDAFVIVRGGVGTLLELALVWNLVMLGASPSKPIVVVGRAWHAVLARMEETLTLTGRHLDLLMLVDDVDQAVSALLAWREQREEQAARGAAR